MSSSAICCVCESRPADAVCVSPTDASGPAGHVRCWDCASSTCAGFEPLAPSHAERIDRTARAFGLDRGKVARVYIGADANQYPLPAGPAEGYISPNGYAIASSANGISAPGSIRMERRATEARDIGTLRMLARIADAAGATTYADHLRTMAGIYVQSNCIDAYVMNPLANLHSSDPHGFIGPALAADVYHPPTDFYVEVVAVADGRATFRSPYGFDDECSLAFLETDANTRGCSAVRSTFNLAR